VSRVATPQERQSFIEALVRWGSPVTQRNGLPAAAMVACGLVESGYGISDIYMQTHCPFNLQKPRWYHWVRCATVNLRTNTRTDAAGRPTQAMLAPFCAAEGTSEGERLADAARIWCEWVLGWPQPGVRARLLKMKHDPELFTQHLPLVGFGEADKAKRNGAVFLSVLREYALVKACMLSLALTGGD
jgi:hypothetical protein